MSRTNYRSRKQINILCNKINTAITYNLISSPIVQNIP